MSTLRKREDSSGVIVVGKWPLVKLGFGQGNRMWVSAAVGADCLPDKLVHECETFQASSISSRSPLWFELERGRNHNVKIEVDRRFRASSGDPLVKDYVVRLVAGQIRIFLGEGPSKVGPAQIREIAVPTV